MYCSFFASFLNSLAPIMQATPTYCFFVRWAQGDPQDWANAQQAIASMHGQSVRGNSAWRGVQDGAPFPPFPNASISMAPLFRLIGHRNFCVAGTSPGLRRSPRVSEKGWTPKMTLGDTDRAPITVVHPTPPHRGGASTGRRREGRRQGGRGTARHPATTVRRGRAEGPV